MKYGESFFDIAYLIIAIGIGVYILAKASSKLQRLMGADAVPILGALMLPKTICYLLILFTFLKKKKNA